MTIPKILIADDDDFSRKLIRGILRPVPCTLSDAANGLEALAAIERDPPDLLLLDVKMPVLDGLATLQEIRASPVHARLPVISMSAHTEREMVMALVELGLAGFLVKPLKPAETLRRLAPVLAAVGRPREPLEGTLTPDGTRRRVRLLLVESDLNFREFARQLLSAHFDVVEADTGVAGYETFRAVEPGVVCVGEHVQMLGVDRLVPLLHAAETRVRPRVFLLSESGRVPPGQEALLNGVLRRTFIPELFNREIRNVLLSTDGTGNTVASLVRGPVRGELTTAVHQAVGVLTAQLITPIDSGEPLDAPVTLVRVELRAATGPTVVAVRLEMSDADAVSFGRRILVGAADCDAREAVTELATAIAGRACASLVTRGFRYVQGPPVLDGALLPPPPDPDALEFRTSDGERIRVTATVVEAGYLAEVAA
ncbi:response regulator [Longimicrobium sp.]|uniref:response regulator n=1 Tax=Longimicrobium sp. TaxID=2029185 RepID=UPI002E343C37|nr:response regulator [Longimicrobium sp.]HEX6037819.1 response regulator [Longimicrobium sp.]